MANIKSAIKRAKQNAKRNILKSSQRSAVRTAVKSVENAVLKKDKKIASEALLEANKVLDRMAGKKVITLNKAARTKSRLNKRVKAAAFIGTLQAGYTNFHYLREVWQETTEKDALIGVSMTGIGSGAVLGYDMQKAADVVKRENSRVAKIIGINKEK